MVEHESVYVFAFPENPSIRVVRRSVCQSCFQIHDSGDYISAATLRGRYSTIHAFLASGYKQCTTMFEGSGCVHLFVKGVECGQRQDFTQSSATTGVVSTTTYSPSFHPAELLMFPRTRALDRTLRRTHVAISGLSSTGEYTVTLEAFSYLARSVVCSAHSRRHRKQILNHALIILLPEFGDPILRVPPW